MADETDSLILQHLHAIRTGQDELRQDVRDLFLRMGNVENELANVHVRVAEQSGRIDRLGGRIERIERRLDLVTPVSPVRP